MSSREIEIKVPARPAGVTKKVIVYCDICNHVQGDTSYGRAGACTICHRDLCQKHIRYEPLGGDYADIYCTYCYDLRFNVMQEKYNNLRILYERDIEALDMTVKAASLALPPERDAAL